MLTVDTNSHARRLGSHAQGWMRTWLLSFPVCLTLACLLLARPPHLLEAQHTEAAHHLGRGHALATLDLWIWEGARRMHACHCKAKVMCCVQVGSGPALGCQAQFTRTILGIACWLAYERPPPPTHFHLLPSPPH